MLEALGIENLDQQIADIVESDIFQAIIYVVVAYIVLIWLASAYWAYRDMRLRSSSAITPYIAALAIIIFTPVFFLFGLLVYRIVRPKETIAEVNERALAEEAMLAEVASHAQCANCSRPVHEEWIICPTCRNRLRRVCPNCEHLIELDWMLCAWCGKDFERVEAAGTTAFMPTARPAPRPQQLPAPRMTAPPPARPAPSPPAQKPAEAPRPNQQPAHPQPANPQPANPQPPTQPQGAPSPAPRSSGATAASASTGAGTQSPTGI
ncbi:MAG TPA: zinc ribbon domain-containing protein [Anaerolineae bacterium]|nr:zinc ribbon domain-containing protein [Anaerolineae bacterium]